MGTGSLRRLLHRASCEQDVVDANPVVADGESLLRIEPVGGRRLATPESMRCTFLSIGRPTPSV